MKKSIALFGFLGVVLSACAQTTVQANIPSVVMNNFQQKFSTATNVEWELEGDIYNVEFDANNNEHEVWIDSKGKIINHKEEIKVNQVPANIREAVKRDFPQYRIDDADKYETDGKVTYKLELDNRTDIEWKVTYDNTGKLLNKIQD